MRYLVTGGAGFIGSHLVEHLVAAGEDVVVLDDLSAGRRENLAAVWGKIRFVEGSVTHPDTGRGVMEGLGCVRHHAAGTSVRRSGQYPAPLHRWTPTGTRHVL